MLHLLKMTVASRVPWESLEHIGEELVKLGHLFEFGTLRTQPLGLLAVLRRRPAQHELENGTQDRANFPEGNLIVHPSQDFLVLTRFDGLPHFVQELAHVLHHCPPALLSPNADLHYGCG
jgi:hypothetical protein